MHFGDGNKFDRNYQFKLSDFNQPIGLKMNPENRWVKKAAAIPWNEIEEKYAALFPGKKGMPAKPLRIAPGALIIQKQYEYSDRELMEQQQYMYDNKVHSVKDGIVSISQPYIRPIVRGKAPAEFGAKLDMSIDEKGLAGLEKLSFDAYNESDILINAVERYRVRTGRYPERVLADQIYRTRKNRAYCKKTGYGRPVLRWADPGR